MEVQLSRLNLLAVLSIRCSKWNASTRFRARVCSHRLPKAVDIFAISKRERISTRTARKFKLVLKGTVIPRSRANEHNSSLRVHVLRDFVIIHIRSNIILILFTKDCP